ncbi:MAG: AAA family ATPase [Chloroflexi bacterium]|nr:AAA family ATPase [Chloroflexota bacterium]
MENITLKNFRCFREEQTARLAPLTLLVGENSTGKTSFMAMIRALFHLAEGFQAPNFKQEPYELGSFDEIAHYRGGRGGRADTFEAAVSGMGMDRVSDEGPHHFEVTFGKKGTIPLPTRRLYSRGDTWLEERSIEGEIYALRLKTRRGSWEWKVPDDSRTQFAGTHNIVHLAYLAGSLQTDDTNITRLNGSPGMTWEDQELLKDTVYDFHFNTQRLYASAPVRSKPRRTYDPSHTTWDPEGDYVPMYLADVYSRDQETWKVLKQRLQGFGRDAGLFDEIAIRPLGKKGSSEPFQVQIRKGDRGLKGSRRNLIDVGYGVSQVLPVLTELLRPDAPDVFLLQQPEVHLHPSAQAALGSLFCQVAGPERQLVVETHSDHLLDRVRMDIRDGKSDLKPDDVSILFFERGDLDVHIHSLRVDDKGNILDAPNGYRSFFMQETARSLGL